MESIRNIIGDNKANKLQAIGERMSYKNAKTKPEIKVSELTFQNHCKRFTSHRVIGKSNQYFYNNELIGIAFFDNSNIKNTRFYIYK